MTGVSEPKIGIEEFLSVARRFGFSPEALERIAQAVSNDDFLGDGPNLARYFSAFPTPPAGEQYEALVRETFDMPYALWGQFRHRGAALRVRRGGRRPGHGSDRPGLGFLATSMAVALAGGIPVFSDVDESLQMDPAKIEALISPRTVALAPTHYMSNVCDMDPIMAIARRHNLKVVEDCAQGPGARYHGRYVGTIGDVGCFSISAYKIIGGGESGLVVTRDERTFERICQCAEAGGLWRPDRFAPPRYEGELFVGTNYRLSELEAAVNLVQFGKLGQLLRQVSAVSVPACCASSIAFARSPRRRSTIRRAISAICCASSRTPVNGQRPSPKRCRPKALPPGIAARSMRRTGIWRAICFPST